MNSIPSPPSATLFTQSKNPNYLFKFNLKVPILPFHSSSSNLTTPCCTIKDSTSVLDKNAPSSEQNSLNYIPPKDSNFEGTLVVRRPVKEFSGQNSDEKEEQDNEAEEEEPEPKASSIDVELTKFAKKMPMFEPGRVESDSTEKPLTVNLDLALYKAKVLTRNFRYEEAEKILQEVRFFRKFCYIWEIGTVWIELLDYIY
jgi:hypothetical protein